MKDKKIILITFGWLIVLGMLMISACNKSAADMIDENSDVPPAESAKETIAESRNSSTSNEIVINGFSADPQELSFSASDGFNLSGTFYPAENKLQPLVILIHWATGDQSDWTEIAYWLQNRELGGTSEITNHEPWLDPSWFPKVEQQVSFNVFTFTFRNCENGCKQFKRDEWYLDTQAAVEFAYKLDGIDKTKIVMIGASIGSDGAVDGCAHLNRLFPNVCKGALAFSPGNYLTVDFEDTVKKLSLGDFPVPVRCFYSESDPESAPVCGNLKARNFQTYPYEGSSVFSNGHGMNLIAPIADPNPLEKVLDFLKTVN